MRGPGWRSLYRLQQCQCSGIGKGALQMYTSCYSFYPKWHPWLLTFHWPKPVHGRPILIKCKATLHTETKKKRKYLVTGPVTTTLACFSVCSKRQMGDLNVHRLSSQLLKVGHIPSTSYEHIISFGQAFTNGVMVTFVSPFGPSSPHFVPGSQTVFLGLVY